MNRTLIACFVTLLIMSGCYAADNSVTKFGAVGDGIMDCTQAFQKALDDASATGGGVVYVPAGKYRFDGSMVIPTGVVLQGTYKSAPLAMNADPSKLVGSVLLVYGGKGSEDGPPFVTLNASATIAGVIIDYPEWSQKVVPPTPYPPCIVGKPGSDNCAVIDCALLNPYQGIIFDQSARFLISNVQGYPIKRGIFVDRCYDIGKVQNIHFWPFGVTYDPADPYCKWINMNGVAFEFARTDWQYVLNTFCFGYGVGYKFSEYKDGGCNGNFVGLGADSCERAVLVEQAQAPGLLITNGEFVGRWSSSDAVTCEIGPKVGGKVSLNNCSFWGPIDKCVTMNAAGGQFTANACNFVNWDVKANGAPAINLVAGQSIIQGNTFVSGQNHIKIGAKVKSAIVMGNQTTDEMMIENAIGKKLISIGNTMNSIEFTKDALKSYRLYVGDEGDSKYLRGWSGREPAREWTPRQGTKRWSLPDAQFTLPIVPGKAYNISLDIAIPAIAVMTGAGLYANDKLIIDLSAPITGTDKMRTGVFTGKLPASKSNTVTLQLKVKNWMPKDVMPNNSDTRQLGAAVRSITMTAKGAKTAVFNANTGEWIK